MKLNWCSKFFRTTAGIFLNLVRWRTCCICSFEDGCLPPTVAQPRIEERVSFFFKRVSFGCSGGGRMGRERAEEGEGQNGMWQWGRKKTIGLPLQSIVVLVEVHKLVQVPLLCDLVPVILLIRVSAIQDGIGVLGVSHCLENVDMYAPNNNITQQHATQNVVGSRSNSRIDVREFLPLPLFLSLPTHLLHLLHLTPPPPHTSSTTHPLHHTHPPPHTHSTPRPPFLTLPPPPLPSLPTPTPPNTTPHHPHHTTPHHTTPHHTTH